MKNLLSIIQQEKANIRLEMSGEDLLVFSNDLINRAKTDYDPDEAELLKQHKYKKKKKQGFRL